MAGTTRGTIYHHFENKADLYKQLLEEASQKGNLAVQTAVTEGGSFADICRRIFVTSLERLANNKRFRQVIALSLFKTGVLPELAQIENKQLQNATAVIEGIAAYMRYGIETGEVRADLKKNLSGYIAICEFRRNLKRISPDFISALVTPHTFYPWAFEITQRRVTEK